MASILASARASQIAWERRPTRERLAVIERFRVGLVNCVDDLLAALDRPGRLAAESLSAEILPLADACRFLVTRGERLLADVVEPAAGRPGWCLGHRVVHRRRPWGCVLVIGPGNYPLFLPGVQTLQALAAGNAVLWKPGRGGLKVAALVRSIWAEAGGDERLLGILSEETAAAEAALDQGVDLVVLTGSSRSGRAVLERAAQRVTPAIVELSGCDAVFVLDSADIKLAARAIAFGLNFNAGATCLAPRRVFVTAVRREALEAALLDEVAKLPEKSVDAVALRFAVQRTHEALADGARMIAGEVPSSSAEVPQERALVKPWLLGNGRPSMAFAQSDLFAPTAMVLVAQNLDEMLEFDCKCPYALGAAVFGASTEAARFARRVRAGCVVVNDFLAPTADPRLSFGGSGASGYGATRGPLGLLAMTRPQAVVTQTLPFRPHLDRIESPRIEQLAALFQWEHGCGVWRRMQALVTLVRETFRK